MVKIIADTTSGLPRQLVKSLGISLIPQIVCFGEDSYRDDTELDTALFLQKLKASSVLPKTAAPPPALYHPIFEQSIKDGQEVVVVAPSAKVSGTVRSAEVAAQEFSNLNVSVIDTQTIAGNLASLVLLAREWAVQDCTAELIVSRLNAWIPRGRIYFLVDTLEYLQKGGRIGGAKALVGQMLQIKPILCLQNGQVEPFEQQRTKRRGLARLVEIVKEQCPCNEDSHLCVMQADAVQDAETLASELRLITGIKSIPVYELPPAIVTHGGPGVLGIGFFVEKAPMV
jgi:DegV family protein with EDD domain